MRKLNVLAILFLVLSLARPEKVEAAPSDFRSLAEAFSFHGKTPGKNAKNWIMLIMLTPRSSPPPIFLISPTTFHVKAPQILIRLSRAQYSSFARYTRAYRCQQTSGGYLPSEFLEATEHANGKTQVICRMPQLAACRYLTGIRAFHAIDRVQPLRSMSVNNIGCE